MSTDKDYASFNDELQDEYGFDAHWPPGIEIGQDVAVDEVDDDYQEPLEIERDCGSGSMAEDGRREVRESRPIVDGENQMIGSAAMYGPTEIGCDDAVGAAVAAVKQAAAAVKSAPPHVAAQHVVAAQKAVARAQQAIASGPYASHGAMEIGAAAAADRPGSELGAGLYSEDGASELGAGLFPEDGASEIGAGEDSHMRGEGGYIAKYGQTEIGLSALDPQVEQAITQTAQYCELAVAQLRAELVAKGVLSPAAARAMPTTAQRLAARKHGHAAATALGGDFEELGVEQKVAKAFQAVKKAQVAVKTAPPSVAVQHVAAAQHATAVAEHAIASGPYASHGAFEIGAAAAADRPGTEIGDDEMGDDELGAGLFPVDGASEIGEELQSPFETFMMDTHRIGDDDDLELAEDGSEIGAGFEGWDPVANSLVGAGHYPTEGASEIGAVKAAVAKVVEKARDNRQPAPPMKVVDVDAPIDEDQHSFLSDIVLGAAAATGEDQFPLLTKLLVRAGSGMDPRVVRVDTEESYKAFRTQQSPELSALNAKLDAHIADPAAHGGIAEEDIDDDIADLVHLGEEAKAAEAQKRVDLWMPKRFEGKIEAWREGNMVCASMALPGRDGDVRICTSFEPVGKCVDEMARHASETSVPAEAIVGVLPAMGCVLGAGTALKEMAAAAPAIIARPEAQVKLPFVVRVEPKTAPNLAALTMLAAAAKMGNTQAQNEWQKLASLSAPQVKAAMIEAVEVAKAATEV